MQKMGLLRNVLKSGHLIRVEHQNPRITSFLRDPPRAFSTAGGPTTRDSSSLLDPFLHKPTTGMIYGTVYGITSHTTKDDILNMLEDSNLTYDDLKVRYTPLFSPIGMLIQFPSRNAFDNAVRALGRKGRGYKLTPNNPELWTKWSAYKPYDGKALLLQGIPHNALQHDIERILSGCHQDGTSPPDVFVRRMDKVQTRMAIVEYPSAYLARLAFLTTIRKYCLNNQVLAQILY